MSDLKPIETIYNNFRFRSRLEARWAVFYDSLNIKYEYEPEGYDFDGVLYLPDFWMPAQKVFIEIKGGRPTEEEEKKAGLLAEHSKRKVFIFWGTMPNPDDLQNDENDSAYYFPCKDGWDSNYCWCECPDCGYLGISFDGRVERIEHRDGCSVKNSHKHYSYNTLNLFNAYVAARMARFEFDR